MSALRAFDTLIDVVLAIDSEMGVRYGNGPASELLEASVKRLASGKPLAQWLEFKGDDFNLADLFAATEATPYRELAFTTSSGREGWVQVSAQPVPAEMLEPDGTPLCLLFLRDVSLEKTLHEKYKAELDQKEAVINDLRAARSQLEDYSKNLEKMVAERTRELSEANRLLRAVLDSLGQGIVVFDGSGRLLPMHSRVAMTLFERSPEGLGAAELLHLSQGERESFARWLEALFGDLLPFEDLVPLGPSRYAHSAGREIVLSYNPMRSPSGSLDGIVMVATDRTNELRALAEANRERRFARMVTLVAGHRQQFRSFAAEAKQLFFSLEEACRQSGPFPIEEVGRWLHTLKGGAASFALDDVAHAAHECEARVVERKEADSAVGDPFSPKFRQELDDALVALRGRFEAFIAAHEEIFGGLRSDGGRVAEVPVAVLMAWSNALARSSDAAAIRDSIERDYVQVPVAESFSHLQTSIQELAFSLGKALEPLRFVGGDLRVVPELWSELFGTFIHAYRNAVDHGLETAEERRGAGKAELGVIESRFARFERAGQRWLRVEISDDGRGIDPSKIARKLESKGQSAWLAGKSADEIIQAVFLDDLSTAEQETEVSGRGVGLSAIKAQAKRMGGDARIESQLGSGSRLVVEVPEPVGDVQPNLQVAV